MRVLNNYVILEKTLTDKSKVILVNNAINEDKATVVYSRSNSIIQPPMKVIYNKLKTIEFTYHNKKYLAIDEKDLFGVCLDE